MDENEEIDNSELEIEFQEGPYLDRECYGTEDIHVLFQKYYPYLDIIDEESEGLVYDENELNELLKEYNLLMHFELFKDIAKWSLSIIDAENEITVIRNQDDLRFNESIDLVSLMFQIRKNKIKWIEITPNIGNKFKITTEDILEKIGEILMYYFPRMEFCEDDSEGRRLVPKKKKKLGKPNSAYPLATLCFMLLKILNNETHLKSESKIVSNDQGRFIFRLLVLSKVLNPEQINVLEEDYIRSLLNNYKNKIPEL